MNNRPNIISITCHDLGRHVGCYGVSTVQTPNLDRMATAGVRFTNSFCPSPGCSPSRASLYTGRYPHNNGVLGLTHDYFAWDLSAGEKHLVHYLNEAGYRSILVGGQHESRHPGRLGFTDGVEDKWLPCEQVADHAINWLNENKSARNPLYMQVGFFEPHRRFDFGGVGPDSEKGVTVPPFLVDDVSAQEEFAEYQGAIKKVDQQIGRLLDWIEGSSLRENTLILFTTDHGMPFPRAKCTLYDPGIEVAHIIKWSGKPWSDGRTVSQLISNIDQVPTILDLLECPIPENIQGKSWMPLLEERSYKARDAIFAEKTYHDYCDPIRCIRTERYKLIVNFSAAPSFSNPSQEYRARSITVVPEDPAYDYHGPVELYDLEQDPGEQVNLAEDLAQVRVRDELLKKLHQWMQETKDPLLEKIPLPPMHQIALCFLQTASGDQTSEAACKGDLK